MKEFEAFIDCGRDVEKIRGMLTAAEKDGFVMANDFNKKIPPAEELFAKFKEHYHGNGHVVLHFFFNDITKRKEIECATASIYRSYPQHKNAYICKI